MSLLSRFRKSVIPSSMRSKKSIDNDVQQQNYRKPTKSFNEKSVKSKSFNSYNSRDGTNYYDGPEKTSRSSSNNKQSRSSIFTPNKSTKSNSNDVDSAALSRSNTFTLEEEANLKNGTDLRANKKDKPSNASPYRESYVATGCDERKGKC